jgi:nucleoside phosphorylase
MRSKILGRPSRLSKRAVGRIPKTSPPSPGATSADLLIVAAHPPELAGLVDLLGGDLRWDVAGHTVFARAVGIGLPAAAAGAASLFAQIRPRAVVLTGTCGSYRGAGRAIGDVIVGDALHLVSTAAAQGKGALPAPMSAVLASDRSLVAGLMQRGGHLADVATTLALTTDDALARDVAHACKCPVEHLEVFAVALACAARAIPFAPVLGVANMVGSTGRDEWRAHHLSAGRAAALLVADWLGSGAPGLAKRG